jgi:hypothetical protein
MRAWLGFVVLPTLTLLTREFELQLLHKLDELRQPLEHLVPSPVVQHKGMEVVRENAREDVGDSGV